MENLIQFRSSTVTPVLQQMRRDMIFGAYPDGAAIRELDLAQRYSCSRTAVRSALLVLEKEGLVAAHPNGTKTVSRLTCEDIHNIYELREFIELTALRQIFRQQNRDLSATLRAVNQIMNSAGLSADMILQIDADFHSSIIQSSRNKALYHAWNNISGVMQTLFQLNISESPEYRDFFLAAFRERHLELFTLFMTDEKTSAEQFSEHIREAREISLKAIEKLKA